MSEENNNMPSQDSADSERSEDCCFCGTLEKPVMEVSETFAFADAWKTAAGTLRICSCEECFTPTNGCDGEWVHLPNDPAEARQNPSPLPEKP